MPCWFFLPSYWQAVPPTNKFHTCKHPSIWHFRPEYSPLWCPHHAQGLADHHSQYYGPETAAPFNLTVATAVSNQNRSLTSQPVLQQYLVDNKGNIDFPVLAACTSADSPRAKPKTSSREKLKTYITEVPIVNVRMANYKFPWWEKWPNPAALLSPTRK